MDILPIRRCCLHLLIVVLLIHDSLADRGSVENQIRSFMSYPVRASKSARVQAILTKHRLRLEATYGLDGLRASIGGSTFRDRSKSVLWRAMFTNRDVTFGTSGGSSTAGACTGSENVFPLFLGRWLEELLKECGSTARVIIKNASHGSTYSLWAASAFETLLGTESLDFLLWEYGINDSRFSSAERQKVLEMWLRRAIVVYGRDVVIGQAYLWDQPQIWPKRTWPPRSGVKSDQDVVTHKYQQHYEIISLNVVPMIQAQNLNKSSVFCDNKHPRASVHQMLADMFAYDFTLAMLDALEEGGPHKGSPSHTRPHIASVPALFQGPVYDVVMNSPAMTRLNYSPKFGKTPTQLQSFSCGSSECIAERRMGKVDPRRFDRKSVTILPRCSSDVSGAVLDLEGTYRVMTLYVPVSKGCIRSADRLPVVFVNGQRVEALDSQAVGLPNVCFFIQPIWYALPLMAGTHSTSLSLCAPDAASVGIAMLTLYPSSS
mmetsp:Transcript_36626/g.59210  ORF Transcript_36626/g.59210 Transcript_36626/m.59210 type:complete len:489 (-) Transcript_36626:226-1692(-)